MDTCPSGGWDRGLGCSGYMRSFFLVMLFCGYMLVLHVQRAKNLWNLSLLDTTTESSLNARLSSRYGIDGAGVGLFNLNFPVALE